MCMLEKVTDLTILGFAVGGIVVTEILLYVEF